MRTFTRSIWISAIAIAAASDLQAQPGFRYMIQDSDPSATLNCLSITPLGSDAYRLGGMLFGSTVPRRFAAMDLHADGTITNAYEVPCDTNAAYAPMILATADGGHLFASFWVADGTDKWAFLKVDAAGNVQWNRYYPDNYGLLIDIQRGMVEKDGHYFVFAHSQDVSPSEGWACVLLELDSAGVLVSHRRFAGGDLWSDDPCALIHDRSGGLITVSVLRPYFSMATFPQITVQRWSPALDLEWSKQYSFGNYHRVTSVNELSDGSLVLTGDVRLNSGLGPFHPFIFKVDTLGQVVWSRRNQGNAPVFFDLAEEDDGSFMAVGFEPQRVIARLDSGGAMIDAHISTLPGTSQPAELLRDTATNEHLVRFAILPEIVRLDTAWMIDCDESPYAWADTIVFPVASDFPISQVVGSMLVNFDSLVVSQPLVATTVDPCLSTAVLMEEVRPAIEAWPVPTTGPLNLGLEDRSEQIMACKVMDGVGRDVLIPAPVLLGDVFQLELGALANGPYIIELRSRTHAHRVMVVKQ
jgi:hypothetical protein